MKQVSLTLDNPVNLVERLADDTFEMPWASLAVAYLELITSGFEDRSPNLAICFWLGGVYYANRWMEQWQEDELQSPRPGPPENDQLLKVCVMGERKLTQLMKSRDVSKLIKISDHKGEGQNNNVHPCPIFYRLFFSLLRFEEEAQKTVRKWLDSSHGVERWVQFYFGLGVVSYWQDMAPHVHEIMKERLTIWVSGEAKTNKIKEVKSIIENLTPNPEPIIVQ